ncbi:arylsulfatase [Mycobacterium sp. IS-1742]|uniref:arylsulfatase n=1 Tax=Mycobacterium sp. IS-1742 TaxID=1772285 RepID=UPI00073FE2D0|nr:arylsulfatase [Mycobacterium sp. IS-1742]KUI30906.1 arylsulfatase [Mycobacterium sp. IS-1742]
MADNSTGAVVAPLLPGGGVLPFAPTPSASIAGRTLAESTYAPRTVPKRLHPDSPNIVIVLIDDAGPGLPSTFGGEVTTATLDRIRAEGVCYNRFHTTAMCSPTRASLLTGRNHHEIGNGQIAELANDWDGYSGKIPRSSATVAEVLKQYGYATSAFGKWHNTPAEETTAAGPFESWPTGLGFEYFYGFLAGEASHYEPHLVRNTTVVTPPRTPEEGYHLSEDLADDAITWLRRHKAFNAEKPFFMYWASGAVHGPHHIMKDWADRYAGKFDDGWDAYRERVFERAKGEGWIPSDCRLTERDATLASWDSIPEDEKPFQRRLMEVAAGYAEHVDMQVGRIADELDRLGFADNTLFFYIWGDNGSSGEGQNGTIAELLAQNGIPTTVRQHIDALDKLGGLDVLGSPLVDNQYHAAWAWAGSTPYKGMKLLASHLGGTRNPMVVRWPAKVPADTTPRELFLHCNDVVPTIYDVVGVEPPRVVYGEPQIPLAGASFARTLTDRAAPGGKKTQYFEIMGSRAIYHDGWMACARGPRLPWVAGQPEGIATWTPDNDVWELYHLDEDWSQASDLAQQQPEKLMQMREMFAIEAARNAVLPVGGGLWVPVYHPELRIAPPFREWEFSGDMVRMPEFCAPALGNKNNVVTIDLDLPADANGVLYALGAAAGGLTCYLDDGHLCYEYNLFILQRTKIRSAHRLSPGPAAVRVITQYAEQHPAGPLDITMTVGGDTVAAGRVPVSAPLLFTANDCLDVGTCLGSPVSMDYRERAPFPFEGRIERMHVAYT